MKNILEAQVTDLAGNRYTVCIEVKYKTGGKLYAAYLPCKLTKNTAYYSTGSSIPEALEALKKAINKDLGKANKTEHITLSREEATVLLEQYDSWVGSSHPDDRESYLDEFSDLRADLIDSGHWK